MHCVTVVKAVLAMSESTCQALRYSGKDCLRSVRTLPKGHLCCRGVQTVSAMSEPTCGALCCRGADCLSSVRTLPAGTVLQWCRLVKWCQNLPAGHCVTVVQAGLSNVRTYLPGTVLRGAVCLSSDGTYLPGTVLQ